MQITSFDEAIGELDGLDTWLMGLGILVKQDRWHKALEVVRRAKEQRELMELGQPRAAIDNYISGLFDAMEICEILRAFRSDSSAALKEKVVRASSGPFAPLQEQVRKNDARNVMFELALAAEWKNRGAEVELGEPDIVLHLGKAVFRVECKRPFYERSVLLNIKDAASQLGKELDKLNNAKAFGIIAISLSRVFTQGNLMCEAPAGGGRQAIRTALMGLVKGHWQEWRVADFLKFHERIAAVMFHLVVPWDIGGERLINLGHGHFVKAGNSEEAWLSLCDKIGGLY